MKGLEHSLVIIVTAIVVLIVAVVLLTIFSQGVGPLTGILDQRNICRQQGIVSCRISGQPPPGWSAEIVVRNENGDKEPTSCFALVPGDCSAILGGGAQSPPDSQPPVPNTQAPS